VGSEIRTFAATRPSEWCRVGLSRRIFRRLMLVYVQRSMLPSLLRYGWRICHVEDKSDLFMKTYIIPSLLDTSIHWMCAECMHAGSKLGRLLASKPSAQFFKNFGSITEISSRYYNRDISEFTRKLKIRLLYCSSVRIMAKMRLKGRSGIRWINVER